MYSATMTLNCSKSGPKLAKSLFWMASKNWRFQLLSRTLKKTSSRVRATMTPSSSRARQRCSEAQYGPASPHARRKTRAHHTLCRQR